MSDQASTNECPLKAGHPPAVKVAGGVRITQHKVSHEKPEPKVDANEDEEAVSESPPKPMILSVSGAPARGDQDFPASSVKAFHEKKPMPTNEFRAANKSHHIIQQPKK